MVESNTNITESQAQSAFEFIKALGITEQYLLKIREILKIQGIDTLNQLIDLQEDVDSWQVPTGVKSKIQAALNLEALKAYLQGIDLSNEIINKIIQLCEDNSIKTFQELIGNQNIIDDSEDLDQNQRQQVINAMNAGQLVGTEESQTEPQFIQSLDNENDPIYYYLDVQDIPDCTEKTIGIIRYLSGQKIQNQDDIYNFNFQEQLQKLNNQLERDNLLNQEIIQYLEQCKTNILNYQFQELNSSIFKISKQFCYVDFNKLIRYLQKNIEAQEKVKNQNIGLLIGETGTGKSTTIHFLSGAKMRQTQQNGITHFEPSQIANEQFVNIKCSALSKSETRYITPATIQLKDLGVNFKNEKSIIICDCPGFNDQGGVEIDIANGYGIVNALRSCSSVRPIILMSGESIGTRGQGIKMIAHILSKMIQNIQMNIDSFIYVFTKLDKKSKQDLNARLKSVQEHMTQDEQNDQGFALFISNMIEETTNGVLSIDILNSKPKDILIPILKKPPIKDKDAFHFSIAQNSLSQLNLECQFIRSSIKIKLQQQDFQYINFKLNQVKFLKEKIDCQELLSTYEDTVKHIVEQNQKSYKSSKEIFNSWFHEKNALQQKDIEIYNQQMINAQGYLVLKNHFINNEIIYDHCSYYDNLKQQCHSVNQQIINTNDFCNTNIRNQISKLFSIKNFIFGQGNNEELSSYFEDSFQKIINFYQDLEKQYHSMLENKDFNNAAKKYKQLINIQKHYGLYYLKGEQIQDQQLQLQKQAQLVLQDLRNILLKINEKIKWDDKDIEEVNTIFYTLQLSQNSQEFIIIISKQFFDDFFKNSVQIIEERCIQLIQKIKDLMNSDQEENEINFGEIEQNLDELNKICILEYIKGKIGYQFNQIVSDISDKIYQIASNAEKILNKILEGKEIVNYRLLKRSIENLEKTQFFTKYKTSTYKNVVEQIKNAILDHFHDVNTLLEENLRIIEKNENIINCFNIIKKIEKMDIFKTIVEEIKISIDQSKERYQTQFDKMINSFQKTFDTKKIEESEQNQQEEIKGDGIEDFNISKTILIKQFDYQKAIEGLRLYKLCDSKNIHVEEFKEIESSIQTYINYFGNTTIKIAQELYKFVFNSDIRFNCKEINHNRFLSQLVFYCEDVFSKLQTIQKNQEEFFNKYFKEKQEEAFNQVEMLRTDLEDQIEFDKHNQEFKNQLGDIQILKQLQILDKYCPKLQIQPLLKKANQEFRQQQSDDNKVVLECLEKNDYFKIYKILKEQKESLSNQSVKASNDECTRSIRLFLDRKCQIIRSQAQFIQNEDFKMEHIKNMSDQINCLPDINDKISQFLEYLPVEKRDIKIEIIKYVKPQILEGVIKKMKQVEGNYSLFQFNDGDEIFKLIVQSVNELRECNLEISTENNYKAQYNLLTNCKKNQLEKKIKVFESMTIDQYFNEGPKQLIEKIQDQNQNQQIEQISKLKEALQKNIEKHINFFIQVNVEDQGLYKTKLEGLLSLIPVEMQMMQKIKLTEIIDQTNKISQILKDQYQDAQNKYDFPQLSILYDSFNKQKIFNFQKEIRNTFASHMKELRDKIYQNINDQQSELLFQNLDIAIKFNLQFNAKFSDDIGPLHEEIIKMVMRQFELQQQDVQESFNFKQLINNDDDVDMVLDKIKNKILGKQLLSIFLLLEQQNPQFIKDFSAMKLIMSKVVEQINKNITEIQQMIEEFINKNSYADSKIYIKLLIGWNESIEDIKNYQGTYKQVIEKQVKTMQKIQLQDIFKKLEQIGQKIYGRLTSQNFLSIKPTMDDNNRIQLFNQTKEIFNDSISLGKLYDIKKDSQVFERLQEMQLYDNFNQQLEKIQLEAEQIFNLNNLKEENYQQLESFNKTIQLLIKFFLHQKQNPLQEQFEKKIKQLNFQGSNCFDDKNKFSEVLIEMQLYQDNVQMFKDIIYQDIDKLLKQFKQQKGDINQLSQILKLKNPDVSKEIIASQKLFEGIENKGRNKRYAEKSLNDIIKPLTGSDLDDNKKATLLKKCQKFNHDYEVSRDIYMGKIAQLIDKDKQPLKKPDIKQCIQSVLMELVSTIKACIADPPKFNQGKIRITNNVKNLIADLIKDIFVYWTLAQSEPYFDNLDEPDKEYLRIPHSGQIICLFSIFGLIDEDLGSNLVQLGTGEGKSVILGITSTVLALLGAQVDCACYSKYLSQRDREGFEEMFNIFGVQDMIKYGTFNEICERKLNSKIDIRKSVLNLVLKAQNQPNQAQYVEPKSKVLLIDEVDTFFSKDFFGEVYVSSASIKGPEVKELVDYIWEQKDNVYTLEDLKGQKQYNQCASLFKSKFLFLLDEICKDLINDSKDFDHTYVILDNKKQIGYQVQDEVSTQIISGYKTMFAYYYNKQKGNLNINDDELNEKVFIQINQGVFSYSAIPESYNYIFGVTGTLDALLQIQKENLIEKKYNILKSTFIPSVFGKSNLNFDTMRDTEVTQPDEQKDQIKRQIENCKKANRPIIIFFENQESIEEFYNYYQTSCYKYESQFITEKTPDDEKKNKIRNAANPKMITLLTKSFGRGTDLVLRHEEVIQNKGIHVLQAFFSDQISEEIQIKGRAARQGNQGSFNIIVNYKQLEKFQLFEEDIKINSGSQNSKLYEYINKSRGEHENQEFIRKLQNIDRIQKDHEFGIQFIEDLQKQNEDRCIEFLRQANIGQQLTEPSRILILLDGTGSMGSLLQQCKNTINIMFEGAIKTISDNKKVKSGFLIQIAIYRNYGCFEKYLIENSGWESKALNLQKFLNQVDARGGEGNEAIEVGFQYANKIHQSKNISQIILIGDAESNTNQEVEHKRERVVVGDLKGEKYWETLINDKIYLREKTNLKRELAIVKQNKIKVYTNYLHKRAQQNFEMIAIETEGESRYLDVTSKSASKELTDLVTETILKDIQSRNNLGNDLVLAYKNKFSYSQ